MLAVHTIGAGTAVLNIRRGQLFGLPMPLKIKKLPQNPYARGKALLENAMKPFAKTRYGKKLSGENLQYAIDVSAGRPEIAKKITAEYNTGLKAEGANPKIAKVIREMLEGSGRRVNWTKTNNAIKNRVKKLWETAQNEKWPDSRFIEEREKIIREEAKRHFES